jgi:hypothetical protein
MIMELREAFDVTFINGEHQLVWAKDPQEALKIGGEMYGLRSATAFPVRKPGA